MTTRPSDDHLIALHATLSTAHNEIEALADRCRERGDEIAAQSLENIAVRLWRSADALAAASSLTWEGRVELAAQATLQEHYGEMYGPGSHPRLADKPKGEADAYRRRARAALRAAFPEYAPQPED